MLFTVLVKGVAVSVKIYMYDLLQPGKGRNYLHFSLAASTTRVCCPFFASDFGMLFQIPKFIPFCSGKRQKKVTSPSEARTRYRAKREKETFLCIAFSSCRC